MQDCERQLLASWINGDNQEHIKEFESFDCYPELFETIKKMKGEINLLSVSRESNISVSNLIKEFSGNAYWPATYEGYYRVKKENKIKDMLIRVASNPVDIAQQINDIYKEVELLQVVKVKEPVDLCEEYKAELEKRKTIEPLKYGIPTLDYITGGIRRQELTTLAARPSVGKTALALQVAFNLALKHHMVLFFPLEMAPAQLMERLACRETDINHNKLKNPAKMNAKDNQNLDLFFDVFEPTVKDYLKVIDGVSKVSEIKKHIEYYKPEAVVIDQLTQLDENRKFGSIREQFSYMTRTLKAFTKSMDIPIILLCQISRSGENKPPTFSDLKESGSIEEDSDNIIALHQTADVIGECTPTDIMILKQRNGKRDICIPCMYQNEKFIFKECTK